MKRIVSLLIILLMILSLFPFSVGAVTTTPTGYTCAEDVEYVIMGGTVVNWGARGEDCTFLTTYALDYYTGADTYSAYSAMTGGTCTADAHSSELYLALQAMMKARHTKIQSYQETRPYYQYTDCLRNDYSLISSFYSGNTVNSTWNGKTYNREHTWPNSKGLGGSDEDDIMMLRPTINSENSSRGNTAYGESSGFFDPGEAVRGDCARIALYVYVRWGNTGRLWGSAGVIESLDILLKWMEEDPVDTWEMARNDSVQSITGVRNVFVDYPELAWQLFGEEIPVGLVTPSGGSVSDAPACAHRQTVLVNQTDVTCTTDGYTGDKVCADCGAQLSSGQTITAEGHRFQDWQTTAEATATTDGVMERECDYCGFVETQTIPATGEPEPTVTEPPATEPPATEPPATEPPATELPATEPPVTEPPVTEPPVTKPSATEPTEGEPAVTVPSETDPTETESTEPQPSETAPSTPQPAEDTFPWPVLLVILLCGTVAVVLIVKKRKK